MILLTNKQFPIYLTEIKRGEDGEKHFIRGKEPFLKMKDHRYATKFIFKLRKAYMGEPNCGLKCPPGREFFVAASVSLTEVILHGKRYHYFLKMIGKKYLRRGIMGLVFVEKKVVYCLES